MESIFTCLGEERSRGGEIMWKVGFSFSFIFLFPFLSLFFFLGAGGLILVKTYVTHH